MGNKTGIEWTDATWNPIRGCSRVSEGCRNCYAEKVAGRFSGPGQPYEGLVRLGVSGGLRRLWNGKVQLVEKHLLDPLKWKNSVKDCSFCSTKLAVLPHICDDEVTRPRRIFVNSMSDLFHENVPDEWIDRIFAVMALCPQHTFQVLTKRPERMLAYLRQVQDEEKDMQRWIRHMDEIGALKKWDEWPEPEWPLPNVQLGVSVEDQKTADERIPLLLQTPAAVRFLSAEPLLGAVDIRHMRHVNLGEHVDLNLDAGKGRFGAAWHDGFPKQADCAKLDWVIVGGESGPGARPMHPDWARSLRDQCAAAGVPFFFKQWGEWAPVPRQWPNDPCSPIMVQRGDIFLTPNGEFDVLGADLGSAYEATGTPMRRVGKKAAGSLLDGREWKEFPGVIQSCGI